MSRSPDQPCSVGWWCRRVIACSTRPVSFFARGVLQEELGDKIEPGPAAAPATPDTGPSASDSDLVVGHQLGAIWAVVAKPKPKLLRPSAVCEHYGATAQRLQAALTDCMPRPNRFEIDRSPDGGRPDRARLNFFETRHQHHAKML